MPIVKDHIPNQLYVVPVKVSCVYFLFLNIIMISLLTFPCSIHFNGSVQDCCNSIANTLEPPVLC